MDVNESNQETRLENLKKVRERFKGLRDALLAERERRKSIMLNRHALFTSMISDYETPDAFYKEYSELLGLLGIDMYFMKRRKSGEEGLTIWIQLDYTEYEEYVIYKKNGKLKVSDTVSWQNEACANEDWNIMSNSDGYDNDDY